MFSSSSCYSPLSKKVMSYIGYKNTKNISYNLWLCCKKILSMTHFSVFCSKREINKPIFVLKTEGHDVFPSSNVLRNLHISYPPSPPAASVFLRWTFYRPSPFLLPFKGRKKGETKREICRTSTEA